MILSDFALVQKLLNTYGDVLGMSLSPWSWLSLLRFWQVSCARETISVLHDSLLGNRIWLWSSLMWFKRNLNICKRKQTSSLLADTEANTVFSVIFISDSEKCHVFDSYHTDLHNTCLYYKPNGFPFWAAPHSYHLIFFSKLSLQRRILWL